MTTGTFNYIDPTSYTSKPWWKFADGPTGPRSFAITTSKPLPVTSLRDHAHCNFNTETSGFELVSNPSAFSASSDFTDEAAIQTTYYPEISAFLKSHLNSRGSDKVKRVVVFGHQVRRRGKEGAGIQQPVLQLHVDQTPSQAAAILRQLVPDAAEADQLLKGRYATINVWRPIENTATDFPLGIIDWRSTKPDDFVAVELLFPVPPKEVVSWVKANLLVQYIALVIGLVLPPILQPQMIVQLVGGLGITLWLSWLVQSIFGIIGLILPPILHPQQIAKLLTLLFTAVASVTSYRLVALPKDPEVGTEKAMSRESWEAKGETFAVVSNPAHRFYYVPDVSVNEVVLLKLFDSYGEGANETGGRKGLAVRAAHSAFLNEKTPAGAPARQSIEVRCLVFYE